MSSARTTRRPDRPDGRGTRRRGIFGVALLIAALAIAACTDRASTGPGNPISAAAAEFATDSLSGGDMTVFDATSNAFGDPGPAISATTLAGHVSGDRIFDGTFVPAPAPVNAGLGPRFDNVSCTGCHTNDGRGQPANGGAFPTILYRISLAGVGPHNGPVPVPGYGLQLELEAVVGVTPEASVTTQYNDSTVMLADGTSITLHEPRYTVSSLYQPITQPYLLSPRVAPPNFGLGLLEAISDSQIEAFASSPAALAAGVAGTVNYVWDSIGGTMRVGRFGLKANTPTIADQVGSAFDNDMGVTSSSFPNEPCSAPTPGCLTHSPDISDSVASLVVTYVRSLGVPARRNVRNASVERGASVFAAAGCATCHLPTIVTGTDAYEPALSHQTIHPYTDLLLHDMGPGLGDNRPDFAASGTQWKTRPLWGIGLTQLVNGRLNFLHDGRAQSLLEAILWHGGQAAPAAAYVQQLPTSDRNALLDFLNSL
jgi:CxxC motif-containing protein (DUF1111 family)